MRHSQTLGTICALAAAAGGVGLYTLGRLHGARVADTTAGTLQPGDADPAAGRRILYWHDPMVPGQRFSTPGKSPFMDMQLVPVYADASGDASTVTISPRVQQNLGIRTAEVLRAPLAIEVVAAGSVAFNTRNEVVVEARAAGYVERLFVRAPLDRVAAGQALAELYVPEWVAAQQEYLVLRGTPRAPNDSLVDAARARMRQLGMTDAQIERVATRNDIEPRVTLIAPIAGLVTELDAREGMTVQAGSRLFRLNGTETLWVNAAVPERELAQLRVGSTVQVRAAALPARVWRSSVQAILPTIDATTRTATVRAELANDDGALTPGMFVELRLAGPSTETLSVPTAALIRTGRRTVAIVAAGDGSFRPVDVVTGMTAGERTEIRSGLTAGQRVVASGQFLIDSEAALRATLDRLAAPDDAAGERP